MDALQYRSARRRWCKTCFKCQSLHLRHYSSTSYINLGYVFSEENESSSSNGNMNSYIASGGLATESMIFELGIASTATETRSYYADEIVYYNFSYKLPITNRINLLASKHYSRI